MLNLSINLPTLLSLPWFKSKVQRISWESLNGGSAEILHAEALY